MTAETFLYVSISVYTFVSLLVCFRCWQWYQDVIDECDSSDLRCKLLWDQLLKDINERIEAAKAEQQITRINKE